MKPESIASWLLILAVGLISAGAFGLGWRIGCIVTGCALFAVVKILCRRGAP